jgi:hypothetical protein
MIFPNELPGGGQPRPAQPAGQVVDSSNHFAVGVRGMEPCIVIHIPVGTALMPIAVSRAEAQNLAAWLSVLADPDGQEIERLKKAICSS